MEKLIGQKKEINHNLENYDATKFPKPSVAVDIAICSFFENDLKILLVKRKKDTEAFPGWWAIPGGFLELARKESLEQAAARELEEETHIKNMYFEQLKTYGDPGRDPREFTPKGTRVISVVYFALVSYDKILEQKIEADDDVDDAKWFSLKSLPKKLAFDHDKILKDLLNRIIGKISYTPIAFELLPKQFTWNELQNIYTVILNKIDTAHNFRRKISSMFEIKKLETKKKAYGRPSFLLEYVSQKSF